jgi:hypothetical protein
MGLSSGVVRRGVGAAATGGHHWTIVTYWAAIWILCQPPLVPSAPEMTGTGIVFGHLYHPHRGSRSPTKKISHIISSKNEIFSLILFALSEEHGTGTGTVGAKSLEQSGANVHSDPKTRCFIKIKIIFVKYRYRLTYI